MDDVARKKCKVCGRMLPVSDFYKNKNTQDGHNTYCKECQKAKQQVARKKSDAQKAYLDALMIGSLNSPDKLIDLVKHALHDFSEEIAEVIKYVDLDNKPSTKRALIDEIQTTYMIKAAEYSRQIASQYSKGV